MHALVSHLRTAAAFAGFSLVAAGLCSCGHQTTPSPTNAALNAPEGAPERAPARPDELKPPANPPQPGHIGRTP